MSEDPRVALFDILALYPDFVVFLGGPPPYGDGAKIAAMEYLYDNADARYEIHRFCRRAFPWAPIPDERRPLMHRIFRTVKRMMARA